MGGLHVSESADGATAEEALTNMLEAFAGEQRAEYGWECPWSKGHVQVWDKPVTDDAVDWMVGWITQHPREGVDPDDKWGPWMLFPLASGGWHIFGWVNT